MMGRNDLFEVRWGMTPSWGGGLDSMKVGEGTCQGSQWQASSSSETVARWELGACDSHVDT